MRNPAVDEDERVGTPKGLAQFDHERLAGSRVNADAEVAVGGKGAFDIDGGRGAVVEGEAGEGGIVEVDDDAFGVSGDGEGGDEGDAARSAREAALAVEGAGVRLFAFHLNIIAPRGAVGLSSAHELVEDDVFELVGKAGLAGEAEQLGVELEPGDGHAGLADVTDVGQVEVIVEKLAVARGAGEIKAVVHDVLPGVEAGFQEPAVAGGAVVFEGAVEAGEHFVGLAVADLIDAFGGEESGNDSGSVGLFPGAQDVLAEFEVAPFAGEAVEQDHGLQHAGGGQADVMAGPDEVALAGGVAEGAAQQVGHAAAGRERVAGCR